MKHLRYLIYVDKGTEPKKHALFWDTEAIHPTYAREQGIRPCDISSLGYIGHNGKNWVFYEHYQLNDEPPKHDKAFIRLSFYQSALSRDHALAEELHKTYQAERHLFQKAVCQKIKNILGISGR